MTKEQTTVDAVVDIAGLEVTFNLPDWFPPERLDYERSILYPKGHVWEGQTDRRMYSNSATDALFKLPGVVEACTDPMGPWVKVKVPPQGDVLRANRATSRSASPFSTPLQTYEGWPSTVEHVS